MRVVVIVAGLALSGAALAETPPPPVAPADAPKGPPPGFRHPGLGPPAPLVKVKVDQSKKPKEAQEKGHAGAAHDHTWPAPPAIPAPGHSG